MDTEKIIKGGRTLAKLSFIIGTVLFLAYFVLSFLFKAEYLLITGYLYLLIALLINTAYLLILVVFWMKKFGSRPVIAKTIGLMLLNLPIAYIYALIVLG